MSSFDWVSLQSACRKAHDRSPPLTFPEIRETFCQHFPEVSRALDEYLEHLVGVELECDAEGGGGDVAEANSNAEVETRITLNVRRALRFSILCQSLGGSNEAIRSNLQEAAVSDLVPWFEGAAVDIFDAAHKGVLSRLPAQLRFTLQNRHEPQSHTAIRRRSLPTWARRRRKSRSSSSTATCAGPARSSRRCSRGPRRR